MSPQETREQDGVGRTVDRPIGLGQRFFHWLIWFVFIGLVGLEGYGFYTAHLFSQQIWLPAGLSRLAQYSGCYLAVAVPALLVAPWIFPALISLAVLVSTAVSVGPQATLAALFFLFSSCTLGLKLLRPAEDSLEPRLWATLLGAGVYIFPMTFLSRLPVNYAAFWTATLAIPVVLDLRGALRLLAYCRDAIRSIDLRPARNRAAFALLMFVLLMHWLIALKPEAGFDALSMHLAIPADISANHGMTFEPSRFIWAVMPMGGDLYYSILYLLGGESAARLGNLAMLLVLEGLLYSAVRRWVKPATGMLILAVFAASPLVQLVTGSLFVENLLAALLMGVMTALWRFAETGGKKPLYLAAALAGTALATKLGALAFLATALPFAVVEVRRQWKSLGPRPVGACVTTGVLLLVTAIPIYAIAYGKTGNPLFPFLNDQFRSPLLVPEAAFRDQRYRRPITWATPFELTFHTSRTYEGQDGSFGFPYLVVVPLSLLILLAAKRPAAASGAIVALGASYLILKSEPNARYLYPALPLMLAPLAALLGSLAARRRWLHRALITFLVASTALNAYFLPSSSWYHKEFCIWPPFSAAAKAHYIATTAPIRQVIEYFNRRHPHAPVLLTADSTIAGLTGDVYENHWHQYMVRDRIHRTLTFPEMVKLLESWHIRYLIAHKPRPGDYARPTALKELLEICTIPEYVSGDSYLARLDPGCERQDQRTLAARAADRAPILVPRGVYDDFDPAIVFRGNWTRTDSVEGPFLHTVSYSDIPGSELSFAFEGTSLTYVFTRAPHLGLAAVTLDGLDKGTVDMYAPQIEYQSRFQFCCLDPGKHLVVIRVTGRRRPVSTGNVVDLDSFVVE